MREFIGLFRGKRVRNGEWIEGNLIRRPTSRRDYFFIKVNEDVSGYLGEYEVEPDTIGECTGLKDLGGTVLFEHDVVTAKFKSNGARFNFKIVFRDGTFLFDNGLAAVPFDKIRSVVKKGNFFDNPELLKGGEE